MKLCTTLSALLSARRALLIGAFAIAGVTLLQGCFPIFAAGVGATALMVSDRRTLGASVDDGAIERKVSNLVRKNYGTINRVNVTSYNRNVLLTGEVQDESVRTEVERLAGTVENVRAVINELVVGPPSTLSSRSGDSAITANVKARFVNNGVFMPNHVKVITEAGSVFLLGIVTSAEADRASEIASTSKGVTKVVRAFEIIGEKEAQAIDTRSAEESNNNSNSFPPEAP